MKKIIKSICFSVLAFLLVIGSFFVPLTSKNMNLAHADNTSYDGLVFESSNIIYSLVGTKTTSWTSTDFSNIDSNNLQFPNFPTAFSPSDSLVNNIYASFLNLSFKITYSGNNIGTSCYGWYSSNTGFAPSSSSVTSYVDTGSFVIPNRNSDFPDIDYNNVRLYNYNIFNYLVNGTVAGTSSIITMVITPSLEGDVLPRPTLVMNSIEIGSSYNFPNRVLFPSNVGVSNVVCYTDTANYQYYFFIPSALPYEDNAVFYSYRKYYTDNAFDFSNTDIYQQGFNSGKNEGLSIGYDNGYSVGSSSGYNEGLEEGKIIGAVESNDYSFFGLISAVIDTPIQLFKSLFNFNFLGVNLFAFFTSILTIGLIVFVTKLFLRR